MTRPDSPNAPIQTQQSPFLHGRLPTDAEGFLHPLSVQQSALNARCAGQATDVHLMPVHTNIMRASGLHHGSIAVINRSRKPKLNDLLAVRFNGAVIMRRLERRAKRFCFVADDPREPVYYVTPETKVERLGVIVDVIGADSPANGFADRQI